MKIRFGNHYHIVLLAAGASTRMGTPKQLKEFRGKPLIRHAAETALQSNGDRVIVVLGANADLIAPIIDDLPVSIVVNSDWELGMGTSIHAGVAAAQAYGANGLILALADQPMVTPAMLSHLLDEHRRTGCGIVTSAYAETVGVPVFFTPAYFPALLSLQPHQGCKGLILANPDHTFRIACPEAEVDIDTPAEYERLVKSEACPG